MSKSFHLKGNFKIYCRQTSKFDTKHNLGTEVVKKMWHGLINKNEFYRPSKVF